MPVGEWTPHHDAVRDEGLHVRRIFGEAGLTAQRQCRVPGWTVTLLDHKEDRHLGTAKHRGRIARPTPTTDPHGSRHESAPTTLRQGVAQ